MKRVLVDLDKCLSCHTCELACGVAHSKAGSLIGAVLSSETPPVSIRVMYAGSVSFPLQCRHCSDAPCVRACMIHALTRDKTTGCVSCDSEKCIGCMMCAMVCPYGAIGELPDSHKIYKCDLCKDVGEPSCVKACPTKALSFEEINSYGSRKREEFVVSYQDLRGSAHHG